jgi:branched-chain amino acid transport system substrate-binding protein
MKKSSVALTVVLAVLAMAGCGPGGEKIKIGVAGPLTGEQGKAGQDLLHGVQLAVSECNARGGVLGRRVVIVAGDDRASDKEAADIAATLCNQGVVGVIGHYNSHCSIAASQIYHQRGIPQISPASTNPRFTEQGYENLFRICGRDDQQGMVAARFALDSLRVAKVAIFHDGTTYGQGLAEEFKKALPLTAGPGEKEPKVVLVSEQQIPLAAEGAVPDYGLYLDPLLSLGPDLIYFGGNYPEAAVLVRQIRERKIEARFLAGDAIANSVFLKVGGMAAEGIYFTFGPAVEDMPQAGHFYGSFKARYGELGPFSIYAYDAANVLLEAVRRAGATAGDSLVKVLRAETFSGALGDIRFDVKGDIMAAPYVVWTVKGGEFVPLKP